MVYKNFKNNNMNKNQKYLAVIPARGGSTRLPRKNLRMMLDKPLIAWTIESAKKSKLLDRIIVSTDDEEIKKIALEYDVEIHHRTPELASELSLVIDTLFDVSKKNPGFNILCLNPTTPVRQKGLIDKCIRIFDDKKYDAVASGIIVKLVPWPTTSMKRTQDMDGFFIDNGGVFVYRESLIAKKTILSQNSGKVLVDKEENVDIDDEFDFKITSFILKDRIQQGLQE